MHGEFAATLFKHLHTKPPHWVVWEIVTRAVEIEQQFVRSAMASDFGHGMTRDRMCQYVRFVGDCCLRKLGVPDTSHQDEAPASTATPYYGDRNPFLFTDLMNVPAQTAFFERSADYTHHGGASGSSPLRRSLNGSSDRGSTRSAKNNKTGGGGGLRQSSASVGRSPSPPRGLRASSAGIPRRQDPQQERDPQAAGLDVDDF